jgi:hypothetical protein
MADNNHLIFDFFNLSHKDKSVAAAKKYFKQAGTVVTSVDVGTAVKKAAGMQYREVQFGFADSQTVSFGVKESGDVFQAKVNGKSVPLKDQHDHAKAVAELVALMTKGRTKFQALLAKAKVALPATIRTAAPRLEQVLREKVGALDEAIGAARETLSGLQATQLGKADAIA